MIRLVVPTLGLCKPKVPVGGMDVAGRVEAVGRHVTRFRPAMRSLTGATGPTPSEPEAGPADCVSSWSRPQSRPLALAESPGDLVLEVLDGGPSGFDTGLPLPGRHDQLGASVTRVGVVVRRSPGTRARRRARPWPAGSYSRTGRVQEPRAGRVDLREHGRVRGLLGESRAEDAVHDAEAEQAIGLTQHGHRVDAAIGVLRVGHGSPRVPEYPAAAATSADAAASIPHSRCRCPAQHDSQDSLGSPAQLAQTSCVQGRTNGRTSPRTARSACPTEHT